MPWKCSHQREVRVVVELVEYLTRGVQDIDATNLTAETRADQFCLDGLRGTVVARADPGSEDQRTP